MDAAYASIFIGIFLTIIIGGALIYVVVAFFMMKVFDKAGVEGKWRAWVPVYNAMVFAKLGDLSPWVALIAWGATILLAPFGLSAIAALLPAAVMAVAAWRIGLKLQKDTPWVILWIFLSPVWLGIAAFDSSRWNTAVAPVPWAGNSFFADTTTWHGIPSQATGMPGYQQPPAGYQPPPAGYQPPPAGYQPPPAAAPQPPEPPAGPPTA